MHPWPLTPTRVRALGGRPVCRRLPVEKDRHGRAAPSNVNPLGVVALQAGRRLKSSTIRPAGGARCHSLCTPTIGTRTHLRTTIEPASTGRAGSDLAGVLPPDTAAG
jgi:hypothetical protein